MAIFFYLLLTNIFCNKQTSHIFISHFKQNDFSHYKIIFLQVNFEIYHGEYEKLLTRIINHRDRGKQIVNNPAESMFLFIDKQQLEVCDFYHNYQ